MRNIVLLSLMASTALLAVESTLSAELLQKYYQVDVVTASGGVQLEKTLINGPSTPPLNIRRATASNSDIEASQESGTNSNIHLLPAPAFSWSFGCSATAAAMIAGYYDRTGYPNVYLGPTNGGVMPLNNSSWGTWVDGSGATRDQCPLSATREGVDGHVGRGHVDDYWIEYGNEDDDPFYTNGWKEHAYSDCTGDFMKTNQMTNHGHSDGGTVFYNYQDSATPLTAELMVTHGIENEDGAYGLKLFFESRGYTVTTLYNQNIDATVEGGFSFEQYKREIDAGHSVLIHVTGHTMAGVGYDAATNTVYLHDTWDYDTHTMVWGGRYSDMDHVSVSVINLESVATKNDFNADGIADILFRDSVTGKNTIFFQSPNGSRASHTYTTTMSDRWSAEGIADFDGNGVSDILFRDASTGENMISFQSADGSRSSHAYTTSISSAWDVAGVADFNGDSIADILFRNASTGKNLIFFQSPDGSRASYAYTSSLSSTWNVAGVADFNNDNITDILFRNASTGKNLIFFQNANGSRASYAYTSKLSSSWDVAGVADFNNDGIADILFRNDGTGKNLIFFQNADGSRASYAYTRKLSSSWDVASVADFNGDDISDILFRNNGTGKNLIFFQNANGSRASYAYTTKMSDTWSVVK